MYYFLEAAGTAGTTGAAGMQGITTIIMLVAVIAVFYFFMYRPQKKQEKAANDMRNNLQVGDEITTIGGIIGKIISIREETVLIVTSGANTKIRILKTAIRSVDVHAEDAE